MAFLVENASKGRAYGRREVAKILRESLLTKTLGLEAFPVDWIATTKGDDAIKEILRSKKSAELETVFDLPETSVRSENLKTGSDDRSYLECLAKSLSLIEDKQ